MVRVCGIMSVEVILGCGKIKFTFNKSVTEYDLTEKEAEKLYDEFLKITRQLDKHRGYYDSHAEVYISKCTRHYKYSCEIVEFTVHDKKMSNKYTLTDEDEAKTLVDLLRDKYRK